MLKLKVFICDNNSSHRNELKKIITDTILIKNYNMTLELSTDDPYKILDVLKKEQVLGIYFLNIHLNSKMNGFQLAAKIRKHDPRGFIIFITLHAEMMYLNFLYKTEAMDYIINDTFNDVPKKINECLKNANEKYINFYNIHNTSPKIFSINTNNKIININFNDIIFFESSSTVHKVILHSINTEIEFYSQMKEIEKKLDNRFLRCHNSFILNKDKIKEIDKKKRIAYMINGSRCLISARGIKLIT